MKTHSHGVVRVVRSDVAGPDRPGRVAWSDGRGRVRLDPGLAARQAPALPVAEPDRKATAFFWEVFTFFMEGFAIYGAALHPNATMPLHTMLAAERDLQPQPDALVPAQNSGRGEAECNGKVVPLDRVRPPGARLERRWNWLRVAAERMSALPTDLRREREIRRAVAALMELDDRTLRDIGILGRADIERMVRYCHDC